MQQPAPKNALGPALKKIRLSRKWTLEDASARLREAGMNCTAQQLGRIEAQMKVIRDFEILYFCAVFEITQDDLGKCLKQTMTRRPSDNNK